MKIDFQFDFYKNFWYNIYRKNIRSKNMIMGKQETDKFFKEAFSLSEQVIV